jgi:tol-pal system protein YbgF
VFGVCGVLGLAACSSTEQLDAIESRLAEIQRQVQQVQRDAATREDLAAMQQQVAEEVSKLVRSGADVSVDLDALSSRIGELQAETEETQNRIEQISRQIADTNLELQSLPRREQPKPPAQSAQLLPTGDPEALYQEAYAQYRGGGYDLAILAFQRYLDTYPETELADNAMYWLGESYFAQGRFHQAVIAFDDVLAKYPRSEKVASAMLKRGYSHLQLGQRERGLDELRAVLETHPSSEEAAIARQQLETLGGQRPGP